MTAGGGARGRAALTLPIRFSGEVEIPMTIGNEGPGDVVLGTADRAAALAAVKAMLRLVSSDDDALIVSLAETALGVAEQFTGLTLIARAMKDEMPASRAWQQLGAKPVRVIHDIAAIDPSGALSLLESAAYAIDIDAIGEGWVRVIDAGGARRIGVTLVAGLADGWAEIPAPIRQGAVLLAAYLFTERDRPGAPPAAVTALWRPFRTLALDRRRHAC